MLYVDCMKNNINMLVWLLFATLAASAFAQKADFEYDTPEGWRSETMKLPLPFAPDMKFRGLDELRFAPGMFKSDRDDFFTYMFVMSLEPGQEVTEQVIKKEFLAYYRGIAKVVGKQAKDDVAKFSLAMKKNPKASKTPKDVQEPVEYHAELTWVEPFVTRKSHELKLEIQSFSFADSDRDYLFVCASPQPRTHDIWTKMRGFRESLRMKEKTMKQDGSQAKEAATP